MPAVTASIELSNILSGIRCFMRFQDTNERNAYGKQNHLDAINLS